MINILDPDVIVLGGGMSNVDRLYANVPKLWGAWVFSDRVDTRLVRNVHGDSSGVRGAAWLWGRAMTPARRSRRVASAARRRIGVTSGATPRADALFARSVDRRQSAGLQAPPRRRKINIGEGSEGSGSEPRSQSEGGQDEQPRIV